MSRRGANPLGPLQNLRDTGYLEPLAPETPRLLRLRLPALVRFVPEVVSSILDSWTQKEHGGVLCCGPITDEGGRIVVAEAAMMLPNMSRSPYSTFLADSRGRAAALRDVLAGGAIPFEFHTHPVRRKRKGSNLAEGFLMLSTSMADQSLANIAVRYRTHVFFVPQVVMVRDLLYGSGLFVGVYGGLVCPPNFEAEVQKAGFARMEEMAKTIRGESPAGGPLNIITRLAPPLLAVLFPDSQKAFATLNSDEGAPFRYWGVLSETNPTDILLPALPDSGWPRAEPQIIDL